MTNSPDLPTQTPHQASYGGGDFDGFIASFSSDGSKLCYGSYAGGNAHDIPEGLAAGNGAIYASGLTSSANIPQRRFEAQRGFAADTGLYEEGNARCYQTGRGPGIQTP